jgi:hypothetical protein
MECSSLSHKLHKTTTTSLHLYHHRNFILYGLINLQANQHPNKISETMSAPAPAVTTSKTQQVQAQVDQVSLSESFKMLVVLLKAGICDD